MSSNPASNGPAYPPTEWSDSASMLDPVRPLPDHPHPSGSPQSPIDREIARSRRASAALAASAAVARAAFTDSQLEAEAAAERADEGDIDDAAWVRTEYAAFDHSTSARAAPDPRRAAVEAHNPVAGTFDPGLVAINSRTFAAASAGARMGVPMRTRGGAQARFRQESRQASRDAHREPAGHAHGEQPTGFSNSHYDKAEVMPVLVAPTPVAPPVAGARRARAGGPSRTLLAGGLGLVVALMAGGVAWRQGLLVPGASPIDRSLVTANVARQAEAARVLGAAEQELRTAPPAAGLPSTVADVPTAAPPEPAAPAPARASTADVDAILAAAARVAPVGRTPTPARETLVAQASWPPQQAPASPSAVAPVPAKAPVAAAQPPALSREEVAQAIARAKARSDGVQSSPAP